jgi:hypothetical protein
MLPDRRACDRFVGVRVANDPESSAGSGFPADGGELFDVIDRSRIVGEFRVSR